MGRLIAGILLAGIVVAGALWMWGRRDRAQAAPVPAAVGAPTTVEVLNGVGVDGLARTITMRLRERGLDVVSYGNAGTDTLAVTQVIARRGDTAAARRVQVALGAGRVVNDPDANLLLDVSVLLGRDVVDSTLRP